MGLRQGADRVVLRPVGRAQPETGQGRLQPGTCTPSMTLTPHSLQHNSLRSHHFTAALLQVLFGRQIIKHALLHIFNHYFNCQMEQTEQHAQASQTYSLSQSCAKCDE